MTIQRPSGLAATRIGTCAGAHLGEPLEAGRVERLDPRALEVADPERRARPGSARSPRARRRPRCRAACGPPARSSTLTVPEPMLAVKARRRSGDTATMCVPCCPVAIAVTAIVAAGVDDGQRLAALGGGEDPPVARARRCRAAPRWARGRSCAASRGVATSKMSIVRAAIGDHRRLPPVGRDRDLVRHLARSPPARARARWRDRRSSDVFSPLLPTSRVPLASAGVAVGCAFPASGAQDKAASARSGIRNRIGPSVEPGRC